MTGTNKDIFDVWDDTKVLVSAFMLHRGVHLRRMVAMGRLGLQMKAQGQSYSAIRHPDGKLFLEMGKRALRFQKALLELERAANGVEALIAGIEADQAQKGADGSF